MIRKKRVKKPISKDQRLIIVHAGNEKGIVPGAFLTYKSTDTTGDYHNEMNNDNYEKWLVNQLIPNIPRDSVLVIDNAPYHNKYVERHGGGPTLTQLNKLSIINSELTSEILLLARRKINMTCMKYECIRTREMLFEYKALVKELRLSNERLMRQLEQAAERGRGFLLSAVPEGGFGETSVTGGSAGAGAPREQYNWEPTPSPAPASAVPGTGDCASGMAPVAAMLGAGRDVSGPALPSARATALMVPGAGYCVSGPPHLRRRRLPRPSPGPAMVYRDPLCL